MTLDILHKWSMIEQQKLDVHLLDTVINTEQDSLHVITVVVILKDTKYTNVDVQHQDAPKEIIQTIQLSVQLMNKSTQIKSTN